MRADNNTRGVLYYVMGKIEGCERRGYVNCGARVSEI